VSGLAGLIDANARGVPRHGPDVRVQVIAAATSAPPWPESTWSHRRIAEQLAVTAISPSQAGRIPADRDLRPYRFRGWLTRKDDPIFWTRARDICDLYLNPPADAVVLSIDEKPHLHRRGQDHPRPPGQRPLTRRQSHPGLAGRTSTPHVHWTPVHASWLNQIELYFSALTRRVIRHGDFPSRHDLITKIETYVIEKTPRPSPTAGPTTAPHSKPHDPRRTNAALH
jgi:hypothetical protein